MNAPWIPAEGIIPPLVTPLKGPNELDVAGLERLVEHVLGGGVHGVFILGTCGEAPCLGYRLRKELIQRTCALVRGRVPVWVGITDTALVEALELAGVAADAGAQAVVAAPPYYFPAGQPELIHFVRMLVAQLPLPLILYNMPQMTKVRFELSTLEALLQFEKIVGLKDSSGDMEYFRQAVALARFRSDWRVWIGPEDRLAEALRSGGHGGISGGAQIAPRWFVSLFEAHRAGDGVSLAAWDTRIRQLGGIYTVGRHASAVVKGLKCALCWMGICSDTMAPPFEPFREPERGRIRQVLEEIGLLSGEPATS
ncbi:MAG: dihydrodipicolinate synthase family protein [Verrucomicrobiota bacterium]|nr:dihydrodipicolinate synthase family protein [Limisphaera sp.]MDW8382072.1 dihydrodipicolinate synthase family protein [Verrucomicrobiota bacterium]